MMREKKEGEIQKRRREGRGEMRKWGKTERWGRDETQEERRL